MVVAPLQREADHVHPNYFAQKSADRALDYPKSMRKHFVASHLRDRYFLFVVKNFKEKPLHDIYQNPLDGPLAFTKVERASIQISWRTAV